MVAPLVFSSVPIDADCLGERWAPNDMDELARFVAMVAMGQSSYAAYILQQLQPAAPLLSDANLRAEAKILLTVEKEPQTPRVTERTDPPSDLQEAYRSTLRLVALMQKAATYLDAVQQELVFFRDGRIHIPVDYGVNDLASLKRTDVDGLVALFNDPVHLHQKLAILSEAVIDIVAGLPADQRFRQLMREAKDIADRVAAGYRLFASSFTYSKIRREVESAQADFLARMHKTFVDLQGQILGIPIATIVIASQLKAAKACGVEVWTNVAVVAGAWLFVLFLIASIVNQWMTLNAISFEFGRQQERLMNDFAEVSTDFNTAFDRLKGRADWHRGVFCVIGGVAILGACFATWVARKLILVDVASCF